LSRIIKAESAEQAGGIGRYRREVLDAQYDGARLGGPDDIIERAQREAERIRREALELGYQDGLQKAREEMEAEMKGLRDTVYSLVEELQQAEARVLKELEPELVRLAVEIAAVILRKEVEVDPEAASRVARLAIKQLVERRQLLIRANVDDIEKLRELKLELSEMFDGVREVEVVEDPEVERGGVIVETPTVRCDARLRTQLNNIFKELLGGGITENRAGEVPQQVGGDTPD